jgi:ribosomal protein S18 acetylase RimI-like enzyme
MDPDQADNQRQEKSVSVRMVRDADEAANYAPQIARWAYGSSPEYFNLLFNEETSALTRLQRWTLRCDSEFSARCCMILFNDGIASGGAIAFAGTELLARRRADLVQLLKESSKIERDTLKNRLARFAHRSIAAEPTDFYIRAIAIDCKARGLGLGRRLLAECEQRGLGMGFSRVSLDVRSDNLVAVRLYERFGFRVVHESEIGDNGWTLWTMVHDLVTR